MQDKARKAYDHAFDLSGWLRQASLFSNKHRPDDRDDGIEAAFETAEQPENLVTEMPGQFEPLQDLRNLCYSLAGSCQFQLGDYWSAYKGARNSEPLHPVLPLTNVTEENSVEATLNTVANQTND